MNVQTEKTPIAPFPGMEPNIRLSLKIAGATVGFSCHKDKVLDALLSLERGMIEVAKGHSREIVTFDEPEISRPLSLLKSYACKYWRIFYNATFGRSETEKRIAEIKKDFAPHISLARTHQYILEASR